MSHRLTVYTVVAELDHEGNLTGQAAEIAPNEDETGYYPFFTTFGTWEAFERQLAAQSRLQEKEEQT